MATEVWFRNPHDYIKELVEVGEYRIAWDRGLLVKKHIDPIKHAQLFLGEAYPWRVLCIGSQGSAEYRPGDTLNKPSAVYPTWVYGESSVLLEEMFASPIGEHKESCNDLNVRPDERPTFGQEHRVIITEIPHAGTGPGRSFLRYLKDLKEQYPDTIVHLHGLYSYKLMFGMGWDAADVEPRTDAQKGKVTLPSGQIVKFEATRSKPQWTKNLGFLPVDLEVPRNRCMFNIKSAVWAGQYYAELYNFRTNKDRKNTVDYESSDEDFTPATVRSPLPAGVNAADTDKFVCNTCTLQDKCKYFREGAVCTVPGAEPVKLAHMFKSRNVDDILDGLSTLVAANTNRLERGLQEEDAIGDLNPEVSKVLGQVFDQGVKLAKLQDPLRFSPKTQGVVVNVGNGAAGISSANPRQLAAQVIQGFINQGIPREAITPEMVQGAVEGAMNPDQQQKAITGTVISHKDDDEQPAAS